MSSRSTFVSSVRRIRGQLSAFSENKLALFGLIVVSGTVALAIAAPVIAPYSPTEQHYDAILMSPSLDHPFGTDVLGRDILSQILFGYRTVYTITFVGVTVAALVGTSLGLIAGYYGGLVDETLMRGIDVMMAFPSLVIGLGIVAALGPSRWSITVALAVAYTPIFARIARGESVSISEETFIKTLRVKGIGDRRILSRHIFFNSFGPISVTFTLQLAFGIITTATLSFLGVGIQPPNPSLGLMLSEGKNFLGQAWWMSLFPGIAIMIPILGFNAIGDGLRDSLDPKQTRR